MSKEEIRNDKKTVGVAPLGDPHIEGMTKKQNNKGITLIALVITIIIMLILVGVSVTVALNGGLFRTAKEAADETEIEKVKEHALSNGQITVDGKTYASYQDYLDGKYVGKVELPEGWTVAETKPEGWSENAIAITDGTNIVPLPLGYKISEKEGEQAIATGLVIKDSKNNEFVWIPVAGSDAFVNPYNYNSSYTEPTTVPDDTQDNLNTYYGTKEDGTTPYYTLETDFVYSDHYVEMVESVNKYDGFYVGRYETTIDEDKNIGSKYNTTVLTAETIIKDGENLNYDNEPFYYRWWGLYYVQRNTNAITGNGSIVQSNMIWGQQWDAMMDFLGETQASSIISSSHSRVLKSGEAVYDNGLKDVMNNIYDLRKNCYEWTAMAIGPFIRDVRGGYYGGVNYSASNTYSYECGVMDRSGFISSRIALCIM